MSGLYPTPKLEDIVFTCAEVVKLLSNPDTLNDWETKFVRDMNDLIGVSTPLSRKQLYQLYKIYFKHVEDDRDAFDDFCSNYKFRDLLSEDQDKWVVTIQ